jgi:hypothetical protein
MTGPVQVLVVGYEHPTFTGEVLAELTRLTEAGLVRLVDVLLVARAADGTFDIVDPTTDAALPWLPQGSGALAAAVLGRVDDADDAAVVTGGDLDATAGPRWSLADAVPVGATAAVALLEHLWAAPLRAAVRRTGGVPLDEFWLAEADLVLLAAAVRTAPA